MEARDLAVKILDEARAQIQANMATHYVTRRQEADLQAMGDDGTMRSRMETWINASGRSSAAFQVVEEDGHVCLVYRGDDVAPFDTIQYGTTDVLSLDEAAEWREDKLRSGAEDMPTAEQIVKGIRERGGTYRHFEPQEWVINTVVDLAVLALNEQLPKAYIRDLTQNINNEIK